MTPEFLQYRKNYMKGDNTVVNSAFIKQVVEAYKDFGWDVSVDLPHLDLSALDESPKSDRSIANDLLDFGMKHAGTAFIIAVGKKANFTALGDLAWIMLTAPDARHALGALIWHSKHIDTALDITTTDEDGRFVLRMDYHLSPGPMRNATHIVAVTVIYKLIGAMHGTSVRGHEMYIDLDFDSGLLHDLQDQFTCPVRYVPNLPTSDISISTDLIDKPNLGYHEATWMKNRRQMQVMVSTGDNDIADLVWAIKAYVMSWNYTRSKPKAGVIANYIGTSERSMRSKLARIETTPKEVISEAEADRIILAMRRGQSMTSAATMYRWTNATDMKKMVMNVAGVDLKAIKPYK